MNGPLWSLSVVLSWKLQYSEAIGSWVPCRLELVLLSWCSSGMSEVSSGTALWVNASVALTIVSAGLEAVAYYELSRFVGLVFGFLESVGWLLFVYSIPDRVTAFVIAPVVVAREGESAMMWLKIFTGALIYWIGIGLCRGQYCLMFVPYSTRSCS